MSISLPHLFIYTIASATAERAVVAVTISREEVVGPVSTAITEGPLAGAASATHEGTRYLVIGI